MTVDMQTCINLSNAVYVGPNANIFEPMKNDGWEQIQLEIELRLGSYTKTDKKFKKLKAA